MIWALLLGCGLGQEPGQDDTATVPTEDPGEVEWVVQPTSLDLGETPADQAVAGAFTLINTGKTDLLVLDLGDDPEDELELSLMDAPMLPPGASVRIEVLWTPEAPGTLDSTLSLSVGGSPDDAQPVTVPVAGTALGPIATISTSSYDFGEIGIGCEDELTLTLTNTGNAPMEVVSVDLHGAEGYSRDAPEGLPWVLAPFQSRQQAVRFSPDELGEAFSELSFETDVGVVTTDLHGDGVVDEERTLSFDVGEQGRSTIIVDVNNTAIPMSSEDQHSAKLVDSLPTFFQTLQDNRASYRAAFVWSVSGTVDGDYAYIDESFTPAEATDAALAMIAPGANGGDNDANFRTLLAAIAANSDWLFETEGWSESRLNLLTIQRDNEASGGSWGHWVSQAQAYKDDPSDIVFHAIAGPIPRGCSGANPFTDYDQAVTATGGAFLSVCEADWNNHMAQIAIACLEGASGIFRLEGSPMESSIQVAVDSVPVSEGWVYDSAKNAVIFEEDAYPPFESIVTVYYWLSGDCG